MPIAQRQIMLLLPEVIFLILHMDFRKFQQMNLNNHFITINRQLLLCRVALGKSFLQFSAMKMAHSPPGHHSVIGKAEQSQINFNQFGFDAIK